MKADRHDGSSTGPGADNARAVVIDKREESDCVVSVEFAAADGGRLPDWSPGAHIDVILPNGLTRQYSLCGDRWAPDSYRVGVLREPDSRGGSRYIHDQLQLGDRVALGCPRNNFPLVPSDAYLFVAGGIGITPLLPMLHQAEMLGADWHLLYGGRRRSSMAFLDEIAKFGDRVTAAPQDERGLLDLSRFLGAPRKGVKVYACGPGPLLDAVKDACLPWPQHTLRIERFMARATDAPPPCTEFEVVLARSGVRVIVGPNVSVLDAARAAGADLLSSCRQGTCGTCEATVLEGQPEHRDSILEDHERLAGDCMFPCVSRSHSQSLVLDI